MIGADESVGGPYTSPTFSVISSVPGNYTFTINFTGNNIDPASTPCTINLTVGGSPYLNVQGGDVSISGSSFGNACTNNPYPNGPAGILTFNSGSPTYQGAGGNLAALSPGFINGYVTSNGSNGYKTNTPTGLSFGNFNLPIVSPFGGELNKTTDCLPDIPDYYAQAAATKLAPYSANTPVLGSTPTNKGAYDFNLGSNLASSSGAGCVTEANSSEYCLLVPTADTYIDITETPSAYFNDKMVLFVDGPTVIGSNIYLNGDTAVGGSYGGPTKIPGFTLIVKGNLGIASGVSRIDGIYIAQPPSVHSTGNDGVISTCTNNDGSNIGFGTLYNTCKTVPLTVDGAMIAQSIKLDRTSGDIGSGTAAETFSYNPNTWIYNDFLGGVPLNTNNSPTELSTANLPPVL